MGPLAAIPDLVRELGASPRRVFASAGVSLRAYPNIDGSRAAEITFTQVRVPASALLGAEGQGLATLEHAVGRVAEIDSADSR